MEFVKKADKENRKRIKREKREQRKEKVEVPAASAREQPVGDTDQRRAQKKPDGTHRGVSRRQAESASVTRRSEHDRHNPHGGLSKPKQTTEPPIDRRPEADEGLSVLVNGLQYRE